MHMPLLLRRAGVHAPRTVGGRVEHPVRPTML